MGEIFILNWNLSFNCLLLYMSLFRLDRNAFKAQSAEEAANHAVYYQRKNWKERLEIAAYLNSVAFNYPLQSPPRLDRTKFKTSSRL